MSPDTGNQQPIEPVVNLDILLSVEYCIWVDFWLQSLLLVSQVDNIRWNILIYLLEYTTILSTYYVIS